MIRLVSFSSRINTTAEKERSHIKRSPIQATRVVNHVSYKRQLCIFNGYDLLTSREPRRWIIQNNISIHLWLRFYEPGFSHTQ